MRSNNPVNTDARGNGVRCISPWARAGYWERLGVATTRVSLSSSSRILRLAPRAGSTSQNKPRRRLYDERTKTPNS